MPKQHKLILPSDNSLRLRPNILPTKYPRNMNKIHKYTNKNTTIHKYIDNSLQLRPNILLTKHPRNMDKRNKYTNMQILKYKYKYSDNSLRLQPNIQPTKYPRNMDKIHLNILETGNNIHQKC